jgi:hypothetical protein
MRRPDACVKTLIHTPMYEALVHTPLSESLIHGMYEALVHQVTLYSSLLSTLPILLYKDSREWQG